MPTTPGNSINEATTGITGFTGTAFVGTALTAHDVLIGGSTSSTITNVAPSATSGVPLISQGASADPAFGTAVVAGGGTGAVTLTGVLIGNGTSAVTANAITQHSVLVGGTSNAITSVTNGTTGQVLTATTSSDPSWQTPASGFSPNSTVQIFDEFLSTDIGANTNIIISQNYWKIQPATITSVSATENSHPGLLSHTALTTGDQFLFLSEAVGGTNIQNFILGGGTLTINWVFKIVNLSNSTNRYVLQFGLSDITATSTPNNGIFINYSDNVNSGQWQGVCRKTSTPSTLNSTTAVTTGWHNAQIIVNAAATSVSFNMDGVSLGTAVATNIPTVALANYTSLHFGAGTIAAGSILWDLFYMTQTLTTPR